MRGRAGGTRGHLLVDYFIALALFMAALGAWLGLTSVELRATGSAERRLAAVAAAETRLAEFRAGAVAPGPFMAAERFELRGDLRLSRRPDGLRAVEVEVRWREPGEAREARIAIATVLPGGGP